jgi:hypothetical protein
MLHIMTVHWQDDQWIDVQLKYLHNHIEQPFKVYAYLNDLPRDHRDKFFYSSTEPIVSHAIKLNLLAEIAHFHADGPDDWLMFIDGDAFPIGDIVAFGRDKLSTYPLLAIQRKENNGDMQPHPSFCLTTMKFWREIGGDWKKGHKWLNPQGRLKSDVGGNLLGILAEKNLDWYPMLRSNKRNLHPLFYGVYEHLVYHHGAGFREPLCRVDKRTRIGSLGRRISKGFQKLPHGTLAKNVRYKLDPVLRVKEQNNQVSQQVWDMIESDPCFYNYFLQAD